MRSQLIIDALYSDKGQDVEDLVEKNIKLAYWLASRLGPRYHLEPEEAEQQAILGLVKAANAFDPEVSSNFGALASSYILNAMRRIAKPIEGEFLQRVDLDAPIGDEEEGGTTAHDIIGQEPEEPQNLGLGEMIQLGLQTLPERDRRMTQMWISGKNYREIAAIEKVSFVYVGKIVTRSMQILRRWLANRGIEP